MLGGGCQAIIYRARHVPGMAHQRPDRAQPSVIMSAGHLLELEFHGLHSLILSSYGAFTIGIGGLVERLPWAGTVEEMGAAHLARRYTVRHRAISDSRTLLGPLHCKIRVSPNWHASRIASGVRILPSAMRAALRIESLTLPNSTSGAR